MTGANFKSARLAKATTAGATLKGAVLTETELEGMVTIRARRRG